MQGHKGASVAKKIEARDSLSRVLSIAGFALSIFTFFYASLDERYSATVLISARSVSLGFGNPPTVSISGWPITFLNSGNQPIAIEGVSFTASALEGEPGDNCDLAKPEPVDLTKMGREHALVKTVPPTDFTPFTVKAGESETRKWNFSGSLFSDAYQLEKDRKPVGRLGCLHIQYVTRAAGRKDIAITTSTIDDMSLPFLLSKDRTVDLINTRWPFYLLWNYLDVKKADAFTASLKPKKPPA
jgi:hypothetical protein